MDKLEPILKQKFWILLGVGVVMTIVGWWMATGSLAATITTRKTALDAVEKSIPSGETPNNSWSVQLAEINARQKVLVDVARREMWERQKARMFWPPTVMDNAGTIAYQGDFPLVATQLYRDNYMHDVEYVWDLVRPFKPLDQSGVVLFNKDRFPHKVGLQLSALTPTSKEIWEYQEDLWLLVPIMDTIRNVNGGENGTRQDAVIHVIEKLQLLGGDRDKLNASSTGASGGGGSEAESSGTMSFSSMGGFNSGMNTSAAGNAAPASADFDPKEEYGDGGSTGGGGSGFGTMGSIGSTETSDSGEMNTTAAGPVVRRYVDDAEALPYKTRAFYLSVIMDHRRVPDFLAQLTANGESDWPIEISRVQMVRLNPDEGMSLQGGQGGYAAALSGGSQQPYSGISSSSFGESSSSFPMPFNPGDSESESSIASSADGFNPGLFSGESGVMGAGRGGAGGGFAGFQATFADPYLARVALCGLIYIYKEVKEEPKEPAPAATPTEPATSTPAGAIPAGEPQPTPAEADPNAPTPATITEPEATPAASDTPAAAPAQPE